MSEIEELLLINYDDCCDYFKSKYGSVPKNYFTDKTCIKKNKVTRGKEGLYIHHIDENKWPSLSNSLEARNAPFGFQKADRLLYCNLLEHFLLHIKIIEYFYFNSRRNLGIGGVYKWIGPELNDIYSGIQYEKLWKQKVTDLTLPLKDDYFKCLEKLKELGWPYPNRSLNEGNKGNNWENKNNIELYKEIEERLGKFKRKIFFSVRNKEIWKYFKKNKKRLSYLNGKEVYYKR